MLLIFEYRFCVTDSSPVMADKKRGQCAFGQDAQAQKCTVNLSCGKSCSGSISIGNRVQLMFLACENKSLLADFHMIFTYHIFSHS
jgi:hypothetical protein